MDEKIKQAIEVLKQGGIVIFPTDTAFGIGCRMDLERSVKKLFEIRKRPLNKATPVLFDTIERIREFVLPFGKDVEQLMFDYWPGALTLILRCNRAKVPILVRGGGETLGVRIPDHDVPLGLIAGTNVPILGPSANFSGESTPFGLSEVNKELIKKVDFVLEGDTKLKGVSTVIDCSGSKWNILRQGILDVGL